MNKLLMELKKDKKKFYTSGLALLLLVLMFAFSTYAFFKSADATNNNFDTTVSTNTTDSLVFETGGDITFTADPSNFNEGMGNQSGSTFLKATLKANNKTNQASAKYFIYLDILENEMEYTYFEEGFDENDYYYRYKKPELLLKVIDPNGKIVTEVSDLEYDSVVDGEGNNQSGFDITNSEKRITIAENYEITCVETEVQEWKFEVMFVNLDIDQQINSGKKFSAKLTVKKENSGVMKSVDDNSFWQHGSKIKSIVFEPELIPKDNAAYTYDVSIIQDESVMAYLIDNGDQTYTTYIQGDGKITANPDCSKLFYYFYKLEKIDGLELFDTSEVKFMNEMFDGCSNLISADVSGWDTSKVINMNGMFLSCNSLTNLDVSGWDTSSVINMTNMFNGCSSLTSLNVTNFNTSKVIDMSSMFSGCSGLTSLDVSNFNTSNVSNMLGMFEGCIKVKNLNVSNWDTSKVISMYEMFYECSNLTNLDVSNFNTSKVTNMLGMFNGCRSLTGLNVSNFNTLQVIDMSFMFGECSMLTNLDVSNFNTSKVRRMCAMFYGCSNLTSIDVSHFDTSEVTDMSGMFERCSGLTTLDVSSFNTIKVKNINGMFSMYDDELGNIDNSLTQIIGLNNFNTSKVTTMRNLFSGCSNLTSLDLSNFDTSKVTDMSWMFYECENLIKLNFKTAVFSQVINNDYMFEKCNNLINVIVKDNKAKTFIEERLAEYNGGTVTIA